MKNWLLFLLLVVSTSPLKAALLGYAYDLELKSDDGTLMHTVNAALVVDTETREFLTVDIYLDKAETFSNNQALDWNAWTYSEITNSWTNSCWGDVNSNYFEGRNLWIGFEFADVFVPEGVDPVAFNPYEHLDNLGALGISVMFDDGSVYVATAPAFKWDLGPYESSDGDGTADAGDVAAVPEPATIALLSAGLFAFAARRRFRVTG